MSNLSIKDVPEAWAESLRQRAARNHRSLQGELMAIIEQAVRDGHEPLTHLSPPENPSDAWARTDARPGTVVGHDRRGHPIMRYGWKTIEQISAEIAAQQPDARPVYTADMPLAVDTIRAERDAR